ncbi:MAG TPA: glycosyltransferase [Gaiellaceae bacterium]|nr:glycosyltransferase [Gaiellaceae bacterium]
MTETAAAPSAALGREQAPPRVRPLLSVIVPVYNQEGSIVENVRTICRRVAEGVAEPFEVIVVSDGSIDRTEECLLETRSDRIRVIHYDRNLGKGYAVKIGSLAARGDWISFVDADLDLDPGSIPLFLDVARQEELDVAIGSKRHPDSIVEYPRSRRTASWLYQQLVRALFRLDVRDTQVGLKLYRREIADAVMPLLLVKRYAFDLELLAVARALGFDQIKELPIALRYRFTGSGVRSIAVLHALIDTAAIFYRARILRYYQRKRSVLGANGLSKALDYRPLVSVIATDARAAERFDYPRSEFVLLDEDATTGRVRAAREARGEVLAFLGSGAEPAGNWLFATVPFLARDEIAAVVTPTMASVRGSAHEQAAAAVWESRLGGGSTHFRFTPGNLRFVRSFPTTNIVVRRADYLAVQQGENASEERLCERLGTLDKRVVYTPESVVVSPKPPPLFRPHLRTVAQYGWARGRSLRLVGAAALRPSTLPPLGLFALLAAGWPLALRGGLLRTTWLAVWVSYGGLVMLAGLAAAVRFRSLRVGVLAAGGAVGTHFVYAPAFLRGFFSKR